MKKFFGLILALALLLGVGVPTAYACSGRHGREQTPQACRFVDANEDGVCDNHGEDCGRNFVDANHQDGICNNRTANTCPRQQMTENHHGTGRGCGRR